MMHRRSHLSLSVIAVLLALSLSCERTDKKKPAPATAPATQPTTTQAAEPEKPLDYVAVVHAIYPRVAATQPLDIPLDLIDAGHFILKHPVYLDTRGDLWITHPDAAPTDDVLKRAPDAQTHVIGDRVAFVHWSINAKGKWVPHLVVQSNSGYELLDPKGRKNIGSGKNYLWSHAQPWGDDRIVVPTDRGISVFNVASEPIEHHQILSDQPSATPPSFSFDPTGLLAWIPWTTKKPGSDGAFRFADEKWTQLNDSNWPPKIIHLVPLLDGSVLQLSAADDETLHLSMSTLGQTNIDEQAVKSLIEQMSDPDPAKRTAAFNELTRYGTASWPILEKLKDDQPVEARIRIQQLLANKIAPTLGGHSLVDGKARVVDRFGDGGILLYADAGVSLAREDQSPTIIAPAWISIRPGHHIELLPEVLTQDADPDKQRIHAFSDEWLISDTTQGPRRLEGNHLQPLLKQNESAFAHLIGIDRRGRWLFQRPSPGLQPRVEELLILDSTIPDPTPRLPIWLLDIKKGEVGWEKNNWPVIKRPGAWFLNESGWQALDEKTNPIITTPPPPLVAPVYKSPTTTTAPATTRSAATRPSGSPLLIDPDSRVYYDGGKTLTVIDKSGHQTIWPLPDTAVASPGAQINLIRDKDGYLFLFNSPGRVLKIKPTPAHAPTTRGAAATQSTQPAQPFELDAVFTHRVPNVDRVTRIWLDPANRIIMAYDTHLAIMFPQGRIPPALQRLIPAIELEDQSPQ